MPVVWTTEFEAVMLCGMYTVTFDTCARQHGAISI